MNITTNNEIIDISQNRGRQGVFNINNRIIYLTRNFNFNYNNMIYT